LGTLAMFREWFEVEFHSIVLDLIEDEEIMHEPVWQLRGRQIDVWQVRVAPRV
jgi:hypothetical protein